MTFRFYKNYSNSISRRLLAWVLIVSSIVTTVLTGMQLGFEYFQDLSDLENNLQLVEEVYAKSVASSVWEMHMPQIQSQLEGIVNIPGIQLAQVVDEGHVLAEAGTMPVGKSIHRTVSLSRFEMNGGKPYGNLEVYANVDQVLQKLYNKVLMIFITQFLKTLIASFGIYFVIQRLLTRHLVSMGRYLQALKFESAMPKLALDRCSLVPKTQDGLVQNENALIKDELDLLVDTINELQAKLQQSYLELNQVNQHLEEKVADKTAQILDQRQKLEYTTKMSFLGEMAGGIAHEINVPLSNLRGNIDLLLKTLEKSDFQKNVFRNVLLANQATVEKVAKIIQGLRTFSRDGSHDPFLPTAVDAIIHGATSLCREKFKNASVDLRIPQLPPDLVINCRSTEIRQVLLNLLNNSFDAVQKLQHKWIQIDMVVTDTEYHLSVTDSGAGLPLDIQERMFQPFFSTKDLGKGTGLGLSVSQGIVENHGGTLMFDSTSNNTRFVIVLPRQLKMQ